VSDSVRKLSRGEVSVSTQSMLDIKPMKSESAVWASYNLGEVMGLRGLASVVPAAVLLFALALTSMAFYRQQD
ncbi:MAG TPA: hypothetical protein VFG30_20680, partial [Polyangiales bacterium]|nr:hypothetical protein [Polyangiales bacterium]